MRRIISLIVCLSAAFAVCRAQNENSETILEKIEQGSHPSLDKRFKETRTHKNGKSSVSPGHLTFRNGNYLKMAYDNEDLFLIDGNHMTNNRGLLKQNADLTKNAMMRGLSRALLCSFNGRLSEFAREQGAEIKAVREGSHYVVSVTAAKKKIQVLTKIVVKYRIQDCSLASIRMDELLGASSLYEWN